MENEKIHAENVARDAPGPRAACGAACGDARGRAARGAAGGARGVQGDPTLTTVLRGHVANDLSGKDMQATGVLHRHAYGYHPSLYDMLIVADRWDSDGTMST